MNTILIGGIGGDTSCSVIWSCLRDLYFVFFTYNIFIYFQAQEQMSLEQYVSIDLYLAAFVAQRGPRSVHDVATDSSKAV